MNLVLVLIIAGILLPKESLSGRRPARRFRPRGHNAAISRHNEITRTITKGQWKKPQKLKEGTEKFIVRWCHSHMYLSNCWKWIFEKVTSRWRLSWFFLIVFQLVEIVQPYESPYEEQFYCKRNGETTKPKETILVLSPHDEYFFKKLGLSQPSGKCDFNLFHL